MLTKLVIVIAGIDQDKISISQHSSKSTHRPIRPMRPIRAPKPVAFVGVVVVVVHGKWLEYA